MIVADANVVIAASNPSDTHHAKATAIVLEHGLDGITLHSLTLAEVLVGPARSGAHVRARHHLETTGFRLFAELLEAPLATLDTRLADAARARNVMVLGLPT